MEREATTTCCGSAGACASALDVVVIGNHLNTLTYDAGLCVNCGMCLMVCPHGVFEAGAQVVALVRPEACMECGACQLNCPTGALDVDSGVGCAAAMIRAALTGGEPTCGSSDGDACCGQASSAPAETGACCGQAQSDAEESASCCGDTQSTARKGGCCGEAPSTAREGGCCGEVRPAFHVERSGCEPAVQILCGTAPGCDEDELCCAGEESCCSETGCCAEDEGGCCKEPGCRHDDPA